MIWLMKCLWCVHHCNKYLTRNINIAFILFYYFINQSLLVINFIVWLSFENIKINIVVSELILVQQIICFLSVKHNDKSRTRIIYFPMYHLFYCLVSFIWSHMLHCSKVSGNISNNIVISWWYLIWPDNF